MVSVELAEPPDETVTGFGLKLPLANFGRPLTLRVTLPAYPVETTLTVSEPLEPTATFIVLLAGVRVTSPDEGGVTVRVALALELL